PERAEDLCTAIVANTPANVRVELLLVDDHLNPCRRELVEVVDGHGDSVRLVPSPRAGEGDAQGASRGEALCERLDAVSISSCSEFVVVPFGERPPLSGLAEATRLLFADGADSVTIVSVPSSPVCAEDSLGVHLGLCGDVSCDRVVIIRRWVARWLFSEIDRSADRSVEITDRARLLGLRSLVVDPSGAQVV
ncbi:MAG: hypothetical protein ACK5O2_11505, partial [Microthrixaceae bacterium]